MVKVQQFDLNMTHAKIILLVSASLATATAIVFSGIIDSIGPIVLYVKRQWQGIDYYQFVPLSIISGALDLMVLDIIARVVFAPQEIPVGIVTALVVFVL
jgi:iron complex transport system permease protein